MDTTIDLSYLLTSRLDSITEKLKAEIIRQLMADASAATNEGQRKILEDLYQNIDASATMGDEGVIADLKFSSINEDNDKNKKEYAELIISNTKSIVSSVLKDYISDLIDKNEVEEIMFNYCKQIAMQQVTGGG